MLDMDGQRITFSPNYWRVPSVERAFEGWIVGKPTTARRAKVLKLVQEERANWRPHAEGLRQVEQLRGFIGHRIVVQFWDPIMYLLEDEGPYPIQGICKDVVTLDEGGFPQAYIILNEGREIPTPRGISSENRLLSNALGEGKLAALAEIYQVWKDSSID